MGDIRRPLIYYNFSVFSDCPDLASKTNQQSKKATTARKSRICLIRHSATFLVSPSSITNEVCMLRKFSTRSVVGKERIRLVVQSSYEAPCSSKNYIHEHVLNGTNRSYHFPTYTWVNWWVDSLFCGHPAEFEDSELHTSNTVPPTRSQSRS